MPKYKTYISWLVENGVKFDNIEYPVAFNVNGSLIGIAASKDIPAGSLLIELPETIIVNRKTILASELGPLIKKHPEVFNKHMEID